MQTRCQLYQQETSNNKQEQQEWHGNHSTLLHFCPAYMLSVSWPTNMNKNDSTENMEETTTNKNRIPIKSIPEWYHMVEW